MDSVKSKIISELLGSVSISELTLAPHSAVSDNSKYVVYTNSSEPYTITSLELFHFLLKRVLLFLVDDDFDLGNLSRIVRSEGASSPIALGRYLAKNYSDWVGPSASTNISDSFLSYFQYHYFSNLSSANSRRTMLLQYGETDSNLFLSPSMWDSNLTGDAHSSSATLKPISGKNLFIPDTALDSSDSSNFERRNYAKVVGHSEYDSPDRISAQNSDDSAWASRGSIEDNPDQLGDIDTTIDSIGKYVDSFFNFFTNKALVYNGMVIITTCTDSLGGIYGGKWDYETFAEPELSSIGKFIRSASDGEGTKERVSYGEETVKVLNVPKHGHTTVSGSSVQQNVAIVGRPEASSCGGVAVMSNIEKSTNTGVAKSEDQVQKITNTAKLITHNNGPYSGGVRYSDLTNNSSTNKQTGHNNMPLYKKVRIAILEDVNGNE